MFGTGPWSYPGALRTRAGRGQLQSSMIEPQFNCIKIYRIPLIVAPGA